MHQNVANVNYFIKLQIQQPLVGLLLKVLQFSMLPIIFVLLCLYEPVFRNWGVCEDIEIKMIKIDI